MPWNVQQLLALPSAQRASALRAAFAEVAGDPEAVRALRTAIASARMGACQQESVPLSELLSSAELSAQIGDLVVLQGEKPNGDREWIAGTLASVDSSGQDRIRLSLAQLQPLTAAAVCRGEERVHVPPASRPDGQFSLTVDYAGDFAGLRCPVAHVSLESSSHGVGTRAAQHAREIFEGTDPCPEAALNWFALHPEIPWTLDPNEPSPTAAQLAEVKREHHTRLAAYLALLIPIALDTPSVVALAVLARHGHFGADFAPAVTNRFLEGMVDGVRIAERALPPEMTAVAERLAKLIRFRQVHQQTEGTSLNHLVTLGLTTAVNPSSKLGQVARELLEARDGQPPEAQQWVQVLGRSRAVLREIAGGDVVALDRVNHFFSRPPPAFEWDPAHFRLAGDAGNEAVTFRPEALQVFEATTGTSLQLEQPDTTGCPARFAIAPSGPVLDQLVDRYERMLLAAAQAIARL